MPALIKQHSIVHHLEDQILDTPLQLTITTFKVKDNIVRTEKLSVLEIDDEVRFIFKFYKSAHKEILQSDPLQKETSKTTKKHASIAVRKEYRCSYMIYKCEYSNYREHEKQIHRQCM